MPDWDAILAELRAIRASMDKIAALVAGEQARAELLPVWACGHRHMTRGEALVCGKQSDNLVPAKADEGAYG